MKSSKKNKNLTDLQILLTPLMGKPALLSAIVIAVVFACLDEPMYACFLLPVLGAFTHVLKRPLQWVVFTSMVVALVSHGRIVNDGETSSHTVDALTGACWIG